jgi:aminoglycoside 3-N-acetyltransferase
VTYSTQEVDDSDFIKLGKIYEEEKGIKAFRIGNAEVRFMKQRDLVDWAVQWMEKNRV